MGVVVSVAVLIRSVLVSEHFKMGTQTSWVGDCPDVVRFCFVVVFVYRRLTGTIQVPIITLRFYYFSEATT